MNTAVTPESSRAHAHLDREALALSSMTDEQAFSSWERFKDVQKRYVAAVMETPEC